MTKIVTIDHDMVTKTRADMYASLAMAKAMPFMHIIVQTLDHATSLMRAKGFNRSYSSMIDVKHSENVRLSVMFNDDEYNTRSVKATAIENTYDGIIVALSSVVSDVDAHPDANVDARDKFRQKLADLTTEAELLDVGMEYIAMLKATAQRLATNALAAPKAPWQADAAPKPWDRDTESDFDSTPPF